MRRWPAFIAFLWALLSLFAPLGCANRQPIAVVGGRAVDRKTYWETMERYYGDDTLRWLIQRELLLQANDEKKLVSEKDVEREFKNFMRGQGFEDERQFLTFLARQGMDKEAFMEDLRFRLILHRLQEEAAKPDDKKLQAFYEQNPSLFTYPPIAKTYILQAADEKTLRKAKELIQKGEDIRKLAYEINKDPQLRSSRGYVEFFLVPDPHLPPALMRIMALLADEKSTPINQLVGPQYIPEGRFWVLVKVIERTPPSVPPFEEIKPYVRARYVESFGPPAETIFQELVKQHPVTVQDPRFKFLEDQIRTQMMVQSPSGFQPPAEVPGLTRPPAQEGEGLEKHVR